MQTELKKLTCICCGGELERKDGKLVCKYCKSSFEEVEKISEEEVVSLNRATTDRSLLRFDEALEEYELLLKKHPDNEMANWGAFLCDYGIIYEQDYNGEYIPTCHRLNERPVKRSPYYAKLNAEHKENAEKIEKLRISIMDKAKKIQPYDVFICYKATEEKHGVSVPTRESKWARDIYEKLTNTYKLRVFFAEKSLAGSNIEYEPHIYSALRSAKLMFVLTTSIEHVNSTWVANEWKRYAKYIRDGEERTLRVIYDSIEPYDLPKELQKAQAIDHDSEWMNAVEKSIAELTKTATLERIEIKGGEIKKKNTYIEMQTLQTREIGVGVVNTSVSEKEMIEIVYEYLESEQWESAKQMLDGILSSNKNCAEALWCKFLIDYKIKGNGYFSEKDRAFTPEALKKIENILNWADKDFATQLLNVLYRAGENFSDATYAKLLQVILPYDYEERSERIEEAFEMAIYGSNMQVFKLLLSTLQSDEVDAYIGYNLEYVGETKDFQEKRYCLNNIIKVHESNVEALELLLDLEMLQGDLSEMISALERLLKCSDEPDKELRDVVFNVLSQSLDKEKQCAFVKEALKYYKGELKELTSLLITLAFRMIKKGFYGETGALFLLNLLVRLVPDNADVYWGICLCKLKVPADTSVPESDIKLTSVPEYPKYLTLVDATRRQLCMALTKKQEEEIERRRLARERLQREAEQERRKKEAEAAAAKARAEAAIRAEEEEKKKKKTRTTIIAIILAVILVIISISIVDCNVRGGCDLELDSNEDGEYYVVTGFTGGDDADVYIPSSYKNIPVKEIGQEAFVDTFYGIRSVTIPNGVTTIGYKAFAETNIVRANIGNTVTTIGDGAFFKCRRLQEIILPDSVTSLGEGTFSGCNEATKLVLSKNITAIEEYAFHNCAKIAHEIVIPEGVTSIGEYAFSYCGLTSIVLPTSLTNLGEKVFYYASNLKSITYQGTVAEWKANVKIGNYWDYGMGTSKVICSDGEVKY